MTFFKWKHHYRDIWEVSSWFHRQRSSKYTLPIWAWSQESVGYFFDVLSIALPVLKSRREKAHRSCKVHLIQSEANVQTIRLQDTTRLEGWDIWVLMTHFASQNFLSWRTVNLTRQAEKINDQHPSLRCNRCILIKLVTLTFQALHIIFITVLLPMARQPQNDRVSWIWNTA